MDGYVLDQGMYDPYQDDPNARAQYTVTRKAAPVMGINFGMSMEQFSAADGTSNTIMFNEVRAGIHALDCRGVWAMGFPGSSVTAANALPLPGYGDCYQPNDREELGDDILWCEKYWYAGIGTRDRMGCSTGYGNTGWPNWQAQARSQHVGGVNAVFGDGSVRFVTNTVSPTVWFYLLSAEDGRQHRYF